jgi:hypothetical protein
MTRTIALAAAVLLALALPAYAQDGGKHGAKAATQPKTEQKTEPKTEPASTPGSSTAPAEKTAAPAAPAAERESPFVGMAGSWSGGGTLSMSGSRERMRCRANHSVSKDGNSLSMNIRCASDSANISLSSHVTYRNGRIHGSWSESSNGLSGSVSGAVSGGSIRAVAHGSNFSAGLSVTTKDGHQQVSITPRGTFITGVYVTLHKR